MKQVYFLRRADGVGPIKIGCSVVPAARLKAMQVWSPHPLEVAAAVPGGFNDEKRLHNQFAEYRLHGEWFEPAPPLLALVARIHATGELPPPPANDRIVQVVARFNGGETLGEIGATFGVSRQRVEQILRKAGIAGRGHRGRGKTCPSWLRLEELRELARRGLPARQIAESIGDSYQNVIRVARVSGISLAKGRKGCSDKTIQTAFAIAEEYKAGHLTAEIADKFGIPQPTIYRYLRIAGVKPARLGSGQSAELPTDQVIRSYRDGETVAAIANTYGVATHTISHMLKRQGVARTHAENEAVRIEAVRRANVRRAEDRKAKAA